MIAVGQFLNAVLEADLRLYTGVPCSFLTPIINAVIDADHLNYVAAVNEGDAIAIACGAELGGLRSVVMLQNSGLGNAVNPLTSLAQTFAIPILLLVTWRGQPDRTLDEPQHRLMGAITPRLLEQMQIPWEMFPTGADSLAEVFARAVDNMVSCGRPYALLVPKGCVSPYELRSRVGCRPRLQLDAVHGLCGSQRQYEPDAVLDSIQVNINEDDALIATTGYTGRALYALKDRPNQLYMVGSMGCASSLGLGVALAQPTRRVVVVDGDGALMMRMGALATLGHYRPPNLVHVLLDNGVHDSTGAQATNSETVDFAAVARACGFPFAERVNDLSRLGQVLAERERKLKFLHVRTQPRTQRKLPRPSITPPEVARRFRAWLQKPISVKI